MPLDQDTITQQLSLLAIHRRTLAHLIEQAAQFGGEVFAPPQTANGIAQTREGIARIKATLRESGVQVKDEPNDEKLPQREPVVSQPTRDANKYLEYFSQIINFLEQINQIVETLISAVNRLRQLNPDPFPLDMAFGYNEIEFLIDAIKDKYENLLSYYGPLKFFIPRNIDDLIGQYKILLIDGMMMIDPSGYRIILPKLRSLSGNIEREMQQHIGNNYLPQTKPITQEDT